MIGETWGEIVCGSRLSKAKTNFKEMRMEARKVLLTVMRNKGKCSPPG